MVTEVREVASGGREDDYEGTFWKSQNILYIVQGGCFIWLLLTTRLPLKPVHFIEYYLYLNKGK